ncbi:F-box protein CPR30-like [Chenopodium quinoa]|uniref:F-box protein CPR30-like n=1 Tax=Chenopodium quinoa TaxID=63459 RepID=UPI000B78A26D|nr:F-box protein CPR30-like [Chenopodium quinoa]
MRRGNSSRLNSFSASLRLVNPITRRCLVLPQAPYALAWRDLNYGLGYSSKTGLFKVVRLYHRQGSAKITAEVMTVRDEGDCAWEVMDTEWSIGITSIRGKPVVLNGALHWLVNYDNLILRFDIDQEKLVIVSHLGILDGLLCVGAPCGLAIDDKSAEIWVMKEYGIEKSWTCFTIIDGLDINGQFVLFLEIKDGKMTLLTTLPRNLSVKGYFIDVYDPKLGKRDKRVPLLEGVDGKTRARGTVDYFVPSFL